MGWLQEFISLEGQPEKSCQLSKKEVEWQKNHGITGNYKRRYDFTWEQKQWLAPGYLTEHTIKGKFDCGLERENRQTGDQTWSIELRDMKFDWNEHTIPEMYFLAALPWRMDITINKSGIIIQGGTWVDYRDTWKIKYKKSIFEHIEDKDRAEKFYQSLSNGKKGNHTQALGLLKNNPLITALCHTVLLNDRINNSKDTEKGEFGERFSSELIKPNYFYEDIHLPLKTTWLQREIENPNQEEWCRIGGLNDGKYQDEELMRLLRKATGIFNLEVPLYVDYSEFYRLDTINNFRIIAFAEQYTETLIKEAWMKSEWLEMTIDEKGVVYG